MTDPGGNGTEGDEGAKGGGRPATEEPAATVTNSLATGDLVTLFGRCTVEYDGRTSRRLGMADRLVLCKPDGTIVVHEANGFQPVAYQSPGATVEVRADEKPDGGETDGAETDGSSTDDAASGGVVVRAERDDPPETLVVAFDRIDEVRSLPVEAPEEPRGPGAEARLRERLLAEPELLEPGFRPLATERETAAGPVDVYGRDAEGRTVIVELKARRVGPDAVGQLARYVDSLERDLHAATAVRGVLVAPAVTERARLLLAEKGLEFVQLAS